MNLGDFLDDMLKAITLLGVIASFVASLRNHTAIKVAAVKNAVDLEVAADKNHDAIQEVKSSLNGKLAQLIDATSAAARAEGVLAGRVDERARQDRQK